MQIKTLWGVLLRRWYLTVGALVLAVAAAVGVVLAVGPVYQADSAVLLLPPTSSTRDSTDGSVVGNPYLALGGLNQARDIVLRAMTSQEASDDLCGEQGSSEYAAMREQLCRVSPSVSYEVTPDYTNSAPLILVSVKADDAENSMVGMRAVSELAPRFLEDLQSDLRLAPSERITSSVVVADTRAQPVHKMQVRIGIVTLAVVLALGLLGIGLLDHLSARGADSSEAGRRVSSASSDDQSDDLEGVGADGWWNLTVGDGDQPAAEADRTSYFSRG